MKILIRTIGICFLLAGVVAIASTTFTQTTFNTLPTNNGDCKAFVDINGDGLADPVVGGSKLYWFESPSFTRHTIDTASNEFTTDMEAVDFDGDMDVDLIVPDNGAGLKWYENNNATLTKRNISTSGYIHDVEVGDIDGDGDIDAASRKSGSDGNTVIIYTRTGTYNFTQSTKTFSMTGEGIKLADIDGDGKLDLVVSGMWASLTGPFVPHTYDSSLTNGLLRIDAKDVNGDGLCDIAVTPSESSGDVAWYEAPTWTKHTLLTNVDNYHTCLLYDLDKNGFSDLLVAQMHTSTNPTIAVWWNYGQGPIDFMLIANDSAHNIAIGDVDNDNDGDLLCVDYISAPTDLRIYVNDLSPSSGVPFDIVIPDSRPHNGNGCGR